MSGIQVNLFRSTDAGAPTLTGMAGSLIALFDACLKDGYNSKTVTLSRSGSTVTATCATAHGFAADGLTKVAISGAAQSEYNGDHSITNVTTLTFDFTVSGTPATPATGAITAKVAPIGWGKPFSDTNKAVYRSAEATGTQMYLRVNDANPLADTNKTAALRGYETLTDMDTGTGPFPTVSQMANGIVIAKSIASDSVARNWTLVGDGFEFCFFYTAWVSNYQNQYDFFHFGDPASEMASDPYGCLIFGPYYGAQSWPGGASIAHQTAASLATSQIGHYMTRGYSQTGDAVNVGKISDASLAGSSYFGGGQMPYPAPHNNGLYIAPVFVGDPAAVVRATLKCIYNPLHSHPLGHGGTVSNLSNLPDRTLYAVTLGYAGALYEVHVDITGPWR